MVEKKRYEIFNKYNPNELIQDNLNVMDGCKQIYDLECIEFELNDLFNRLKKIYDICNDCLTNDKINEVGYLVGFTEIKKIVEESVEELSECKLGDFIK